MVAVTVPGTVEEWHRPGIPVISSKVRQFSPGFYLLKGKVRAGEIALTGLNPCFAELPIYVTFFDGDCMAKLALDYTDLKRDEKKLMGIVEKTPLDGLEGLVGVHYVMRSGLIVNYLKISSLVEAFVKNKRVVRMSVPPAGAAPAAEYT